eukprot:1153323-Amphidinium_carterae.1
MVMLLLLLLLMLLLLMLLLLMMMMMHVPKVTFFVVARPAAWSVTLCAGAREYEEAERGSFSGVRRMCDSDS